jgi:hypothetical protein
MHGKNRYSAVFRVPRVTKWMCRLLSKIGDDVPGLTWKVRAITLENPNPGVFDVYRHCIHLVVARIL